MSAHLPASRTGPAHIHPGDIRTCNVIGKRVWLYGLMYIYQQWKWERKILKFGKWEVGSEKWEVRIEGITMQRSEREKRETRNEGPKARVKNITTYLNGVRHRGIFIPEATPTTSWLYLPTLATQPLATSYTDNFLLLATFITLRILYGFYHKRGLLMRDL